MSGSYDILRLAGLISEVKVLQDVRNAKLNRYGSDSPASLFLGYSLPV